MKKHVLWNTIGSIVYSVCQWAMTILIVHISSYENAGYLSLAMTTSSSFAIIALFSMRNFQISDVKAEFSASTYLSSRIVTAFLSLLLCIPISFIGNSFYQALCINAFMIIRIVEAYADVIHGEFQKYDMYESIGKSFLFRGILSLIIFVVCDYFSKNLFLSLLLVSIVEFVFLWFYDWRILKKKEDFKISINKQMFILLKKCLPIVCFSYLFSLENLIPKIVLKNSMGTEILGIYSTIASPTLVVQLFALVVFNPFLPSISLLIKKSDHYNLRRIMIKTYLALVVLMIVTILGALLLGKWGLVLLFGKEILEYYDLFIPMVVVTILTAMVWILSAIIIAFRDIKFLIICMIIDFILCLVVVNKMILSFGMNGTSYVQILSYSVLIVMMLVKCEIEIKKMRPI